MFPILIKTEWRVNIMSKNSLLNAITSGVMKATFKAKKHSPEILVAAGVVGVVTSTVLACKATLKVHEVMEETQTNLEAIESYVEKNGYTEKYTEKDATNDKRITYGTAALKFVKLYGPSVLLGVASIGCIVASHNILSKRNIALAAAYSTVDKGFKEYRGRVIERFGSKIDKELKYNIKEYVDSKETIVNEDGEVEEKTGVVPVIDSEDVSQYARFFDETSHAWTKDANYNLMFLRAQQNYANDKLKAQGYLYLNDVYKMLGIAPSPEGQVVGWTYDLEHPNGDNYIDFGIYNTKRKSSREFVNGYEKSILLDFNVDGNILNLM